MPKATFEKLSYPALSPTMMCVQLADSTIRYPEGIVHNLLVQVKGYFHCCGLCGSRYGRRSEDISYSWATISERCQSYHWCWNWEDQPPHHGKEHEIQVPKQETRTVPDSWGWQKRRTACWTRLGRMGGPWASNRTSLGRLVNLWASNRSNLGEVPSSKSIILYCLLLVKIK